MWRRGGYVIIFFFEVFTLHRTHTCVLMARFMVSTCLASGFPFKIPQAVCTSISHFSFVLLFLSPFYCCFFFGEGGLVNIEEEREETNQHVKGRTLILGQQLPLLIRGQFLQGFNSASRKVLLALREGVMMATRITLKSKKDLPITDRMRT